MIDKREIVDQNQTKAWIKYPQPGEQYTHYKGGLYEIILLAEDDKNQVVVVYRSILFGSYRTRPLTEWFDEVPAKTETGDNVKTVRFKLKN